jgi:hypothetical protein
MIPVTSASSMCLKNKREFYELKELGWPPPGTGALDV